MGLHDKPPGQHGTEAGAEREIQLGDLTGLRLSLNDRHHILSAVMYALRTKADTDEQVRQIIECDLPLSEGGLTIPLTWLGRRFTLSFSFDQFDRLVGFGTVETHPVH